MPPPVGPPLYPPPDGGWGWVVVGASFISIGFSYAFPRAVTVFFKEIQQIFKIDYIRKCTLERLHDKGVLVSNLLHTRGFISRRKPVITGHMSNL